MIVTPADASKAEKFALGQRVHFFSMLRMDESKSGGDLEHCRRAFGLADTDPLKFDGMLAMPILGRLFANGALRFEAKS